jgi:hypothetical protein
MQMVFLFLPRRLLAQLTGDKDRLLEARCQFLITRVRVWEGIKWLFADDPLLRTDR